ncbi:MAG TPA: YciI family protein [Thermoanaerobaculia bacterium]|nr:YciI family protein [Thermoanaerobaculia bacterium]
MKYLCLAYYDVTKFDALTEDDMAAIGRACQPYDEELQQSGHLLLSGSLGLARATTTLRPGNGKPSITDGPFVETKEQVGGFFMIEARDLNEAIQVASRHPAAHMNEHLGWAVEVRPIEVCQAAEAWKARQEANG